MRLAKPTRILLYIVLILFVFAFVLPFYADLTTALKKDSDVVSTIPVEPPPSPTLGPLITALVGASNVQGMARPLLTTVTFTVFATILSCIIGSINGYVLSKIRFRGSDMLFIFFSIGIFIPYQAVLIPLVLTMARLGLFNTLGALILAHTAYGIPICTLLFRNFYREIPDSLVMAAKTDGAGTWRIYQSIFLPLSGLPFVVAGVFQFTSIWNDFLFALVLLAGPNQAASVVLPNLKGTNTSSWNLLMGGAIWYALPLVIVYLVLGKYLIKGYMAGAVKG
ncbi:MAG: carbohydrate ABC transporter permease [Candidatus Bathyarchaeia archaeon]|jgi:glucose/mannose transport system permease protein